MGVNKHGQWCVCVCVCVSTGVNKHGQWCVCVCMCVCLYDEMRDISMDRYMDIQIYVLWLLKNRH